MSSPIGWLLAATLVLWSLSASPYLASLVLSYALAWIPINFIARSRPRWLAGKAHGIPRTWLMALVIISPMLVLLRALPAMTEEEGLAGLLEPQRARVRLESLPSIAPPLVRTDLPQTFYIHAPGGTNVHLQLGVDGPSLSTVPLGEGLFRVSYDPRHQGFSAPPDGPVNAEIEVDGRVFERQLRAVNVLPHPRWLSPSTNGQNAATLSEETDEAFVLDRRGLVSRFRTADGPSDVRHVISESAEGAWAISHRYARDLVFYDREGHVTGRVEVGYFGTHLAVDRNHRWLVLTRGGRHPEVLLIDASTRRVVARSALDFVPEWVAFGSDASEFVISSRQPAALHRWRRRGRGLQSVGAPLLLGRPAVHLSEGAVAGTLVLATTDLVGEGPVHLGNHYVNDQILWVDVPTWRIDRRLLTSRRSPRQDQPGGLDRGLSPMQLSEDSEGRLWAVFAGSDELWSLDPIGRAGDPRIWDLAPEHVPNPQGLARLADGTCLVSSASHGVIGIFSPEGQRRALVRLAPSDQDLLSDDHEALKRRIGERGFYEGTRSGISCQSCHLHGQSDGTLQNIGGRTLVGTLDVRGLMGTPPYLRDGGYPSLEAFDEVSSSVFRGFRRSQGGRRTGLRTYIQGLARPTPFSQLEGRDLDRERRGLSAYVRARCPLCHSFPAFTNLGQHPPRLLFPQGIGPATGEHLDTPSLLGLSSSAPYLLDGRARTLPAVFDTEDPAHRHGDTAALDEDALSDLLYFLGDL